MTVIPENLRENPLLRDWKDSSDLPAFTAIRSEHFEPALRFAMDVSRDEIKAITGQRAKPTFDNTILALERSGTLLDRVSSTFNMLCGVASTDEMQALNGKLSPLLSKHGSWLYQNKALFKRVDAVYQSREELPPVQRRLVERVHKNFVDSGAAHAPEKKKRLAKLDADGAKLSAKFDARWTNQVKKPTLLLSKESELAGLPQFVRDAAAQAATELGKPGKYAFMATGPVMENFVTYSTRRDLREKLFTAWQTRNDHDDRFDTKAIASAMLANAAETAELLGYANPAAFYLKDNMVKTPARAEALLQESWDAAKVAYLRERAELSGFAQAQGLNEPLQPWDWRYYANQIREQKYKLSDDELKPYLSLENVREAAFATVKELWGIEFREVKDAKLYHEDARLWDVVDADGSTIGKFIGDYYARPTKQQGAWMGELRTQHGLDGGQQPIVYNVCNISKAPEGQPTLLSLEEARTLFHELGHGLHGLLSRVEYPSLAGCNGPMDYVELPSQLFEKFLLTAPIMKHLRHAETGEVMPQTLADKIHASDNLTKGHEMMEYLTSAVVDLELHKLKDASKLDLRAFEKETLEKWGAPTGATLRHRMPHFSHIFGGGYSAAYHSYEYAAMLDTDGFDAFPNKDNPFAAKAVATALRTEIYASGAARDPLESYVAFRGREPQMTALFKSRGFTPA